MSTSLPKFIADDSLAITQEMIDAYEAMTGKTLYPAQVERLLIDLIAYRETLVRTAINDTARQNLMAFARAPMLDYLGELVGVTRLPAQSARTRVRLTLVEPLTAGLAIPAGFRVETTNGVQFQTLDEVVMSAGASQVELAVLAVEPGLAGNGYLPGQVSQWVDSLGVDLDDVSNLVVTAGGAEAESDERLRERIKLAPESFSVAGSRLAYRHHAMSAHQDIVDVAVDSPEPGVVRLFPLGRDGLPGPALLNAVTLACSDEKVRPLTEQVQVLAPEEIAFTLHARLLVYHDADAGRVLSTARTQAMQLANSLSASLGRDIVPSQFIAALSVPGVYQVELISPTATREVGAAGWAHCLAMDVQLSGERNG